MKRSLTFLVTALTWIALLSDFAPACTAFIVKRGPAVMVGNNEDSLEANLRVWFLPGGPGRHGMVYFGTCGESLREESREGGMNDRGLFVDGFSLPRREVDPSRGTHVSKLPFDFVDRALAECGTVKEVEALARRHRILLFEAQWMFGDRNGHSIIIEGEKIVHGDGRFQVCTNFRHSELGGSAPACRRYREAVRLLTKMGDPTVGACRDVLRAVHLRNTQYSYVLDLNARRIHYFHFHDFGHAVVFDLGVELAKGAHQIDMVPLFPDKLGPRIFADLRVAYLLSFAMTFFVVTLLFWGVRSLVRRLRRLSPGKTGPAGRRARRAGLIAAATSALHSAYLVALLDVPERIPFRGPAPPARGGWLWFGLRLVPWLAAALTSWWAWASIGVWRERFWSLAGRIHYTLAAGLAVAVVVVWVRLGLLA